MVAFSVPHCNGQISKGKSFVTGSLGFKKTRDVNSFLFDLRPPDYRENTFHGSIAFNYLLTDRLSIGPIYRFSHRWGKFSELTQIAPFEFSNNGEFTEDNYSIGLNIRYFFPVADRLHFFLSTAGQINRIRSRVDYFDQNINSNADGHRFSIAPGFNYIISDKWSVNMEIGEVYFEKIYPVESPELYLTDAVIDFDPGNIQLSIQFHIYRQEGKREKRRLEKEESNLVPMFEEEGK